MMSSVGTLGNVTAFQSTAVRPRRAHRAAARYLIVHLFACTKYLWCERSAYATFETESNCNFRVSPRIDQRWCLRLTSFILLKTIYNSCDAALHRRQNDMEVFGLDEINNCMDCARTLCNRATYAAGSECSSLMRLNLVAGFVGQWLPYRMNGPAL
jgi:hypothetical protein